MKITEKQLVNLIQESVEDALCEKDKEFDPYNYSFNGFGEGEFDSLYDDKDQADMEKELIDLVIDGEALFKKMKEVIETSKYYEKNNTDEKLLRYLDRINKITDIIKDFWS
jgi:hypothetical protein